METPCPTEAFLFEGFRLDRRGLFTCEGSAALAPVEIGSRALEILAVLLRKPGDLVSRDEIMAAAWPGTVVEDHNLTVQISTLRRVLDQDRAQGSCIQTVPGRGYRFVAPVTWVEPAAPVHVAYPPEGSGGSQDSCHARESGYSGQISASVVLDPRLRGGDGDLMRSGLIRACANLRNVVQGVSGRYRPRAGVLAAAIGAMVLIAAIGTWRISWPWNSHPAPRLSIVVLPFANLGNDPEQQYFADGVTEDLTIDLSRLADMFVISRNTAFTYRSKQVDTKQIGRELGVRYVLEGSVQRSGNQLRIAAQLIDAETDAHLWAERFEGGTVDLFALRNEITSQIASALGVELIAREAARPNDHPDALDYILQGRAAGAKGPARENAAQAISLFERALALDPQSVEAQSRLAAALVVRVIIGTSDSAAADIARADRLVGQALAASSRNWYAHWVKGQVLRAQHRCEDAIPEYETALAFNRNGAVAFSSLGWCKLYAGSTEEVIPLMEQAIRLSPRDPAIGFFYGAIGFVHLLQSRNDEAILWLEKARSALPGMPHAYLASAYALKGETDRAAAELAEARRLSGDGRYSSIARVKADGPISGYWGVPKIRALVEATYFAGLRKAGMPEE